MRYVLIYSSKKENDENNEFIKKMSSRSKKSKTTANSEKKPDETNLTQVTDAQPMTEQPKPENPEATTDRKGKSRKKKLTAKERKRLKLEQLERERQQQLAEKANREAEERRKREREMALAGQQRLQNEETQLKEFREARILNNTTIRADAAKQNEWETYLHCDHSTNPLDKADVNSFVTLWREADDTNMQVLFDHITTAVKLINQLTNLRYNAEVAVNNEEVTRFTQHITDIRTLITQKIELLTQHHLMFSDKYTGAKSEVLLNAESSGYQYGLWVNLAKNPRIKDVEFNGVSVEISKPVAMASLAIRIKITPSCIEYPKYTLLSSVMSCEFFQLPSPPKRVTTYVLRQSSAASLIPIAYPLKSNNSPQPPLVFKMKIDPSRLPENLETVTVVKIDDIDNTQNLISDVKLDIEAGTVTFACKTTGVFALAVPKYNQFPFSFWEVNSPVADTVELFVRTNATEVAITIDKNGLCSSDSPTPFSNISAAAALDLLRDHGFNLIAPQDVSEINDQRIHGKPPTLEEVFSQGIADTATGFRIRASCKNSQVSRGEHEDPRIIILAREIVNFGESITEDEAVEEEDEEEQKEEKLEGAESSAPQTLTQTQPTGDAGQPAKKEEKKQTRWRCVQGTEKIIFESRNTENEEQTDIEMLPNTAFHQHVMPMLMDLASEDVQQRVLKASGFIAETLKYLLSRLRLFSTTI